MLRRLTVTGLFVALVAGCGDSSGNGSGAGGTGMAAGSGGSAGAGFGGSGVTAGLGPVAGSGGDAATGGSGQGGAGQAGSSGAGSGGVSADGGAGMGGLGGAAAAAGAGGSAGAAGGGCIVPATADAEPMLLSQTGCVDPSDPTRADPSLIPYEVNSPLWSDAATKERYIFLPPGAKIHVNDCSEPDACPPPGLGGTGEDDGHWDMPVGAVLMKVFLLDGKRVETRLLMHRTEATWQGYSFEWNDDETEATLLPDEKDKPIGDQVWHYPSRSQCLECHTKAAGRSLGPTTAQLNRDHDYPDGTMNQVDKFAALGLFDSDPRRIPGYPDPQSTTADLETRARSYLHANCAVCHRPGGPVSDVDLRFTTSFADTLLCNGQVIKGTGDPMVPQIRLVPGHPEESALSYRMHATDSYRMPKIGSSVVDPAGTQLIDDWITSITDCP